MFTSVTSTIVSLVASVVDLVPLMSTYWYASHTLQPTLLQRPQQTHQQQQQLQHRLATIEQQEHLGRRQLRRDFASVLADLPLDDLSLSCQLQVLHHRIRQVRDHHIDAKQHKQAQERLLRWFDEISGSACARFSSKYLSTLLDQHKAVILRCLAYDAYLVRCNTALGSDECMQRLDIYGLAKIADEYNIAPARNMAALLGVTFGESDFAKKKLVSWRVKRQQLKPTAASAAILYEEVCKKSKLVERQVKSSLRSQRQVVHRRLVQAERAFNVSVLQLSVATQRLCRLLKKLHRAAEATTNNSNNNTNLQSISSSSTSASPCLHDAGAKLKKSRKNNNNNNTKSNTRLQKLDSSSPSPCTTSNNKRPRHRRSQQQQQPQQSTQSRGLEKIHLIECTACSQQLPGSQFTSSQQHRNDRRCRTCVQAQRASLVRKEQPAQIAVAAVVAVQPSPQTAVEEQIKCVACDVVKPRSSFSRCQLRRRSRLCRCNDCIKDGKTRPRWIESPPVVQPTQLESARPAVAAVGTVASPTTTSSSPSTAQVQSSPSCSALAAPEQQQQHDSKPSSTQQREQKRQIALPTRKQRQHSSSSASQPTQQQSPQQVQQRQPASVAEDLQRVRRKFAQRNRMRPPTRNELIDLWVDLLFDGDGRNGDFGAPPARSVSRDADGDDDGDGGFAQWVSRLQNGHVDADVDERGVDGEDEDGVDVECEELLDQIPYHYEDDREFVAPDQQQQNDDDDLTF